MAKPSVAIPGSKIFATGAASGIGRATALEMARRGGKMILADINEDGLKETVKMIEDAGGTVLAYRKINVMSEDEVRAFADEIHQKFGAIDILLNIAGVLMFGEMQDMAHKDWEFILGVNLWGPIHTISAFLPEMIKQKKGHIFNVASMCGLVGHPWQTAYTASKHAIVGISEVLRYDLRQYNIGVSIICPGAVKTGMVAAVKILHPDPERANKTKGYFSKVGTTPENIVDRIIKTMEKNKFINVTPDMSWIWYAKRYLPPVYEAYQRTFFWVWNWMMKK